MVGKQFAAAGYHEPLAGNPSTEDKRMRALLFTAILCLAFPLSAISDSRPEKEAAAITAAERFLDLVDQEKYGESWDVASSLFVSRISREEWQNTVAGVRPPLGSPVHRSVKSSKYMTSAPGVPDGEYVVILFSSSFEHKKSAVETVTAMYDKDGQWRVAGYFIK